MVRLLITTFIWAFSFSLIGHFIAGKVDTYLAMALRFALAGLCFLPFALKEKSTTLEKIKMMAIGSLQIGLMYICYYNSYKHLSVSEVALFTITTPLYISLLSSFNKKSFNLFQLFNAFYSQIFV